MEFISNLSSQISQFMPGFNLLDLIIIVVILFYAYEGYALGFVLAFTDLVSFILAFIAALKLYGGLASLLVLFFSLPLGFANAISFFLIAFISEIILTIVFRRVIRHMPSIHPSRPAYQFFKKIDRFLGLVPGMLSAFIILSFLLTLIVSLPSSPLIKNLVTGSQIGAKLITNTSLFENRLNDIFGGALNETMNFLTIEPKSNETVELHFKVEDGTPDPQAEQEMFKMINTERVKNGLPPVFFDDKLRDVARAHSSDMFARGYFSHYTPDGLSPFDRMDKAGIEYLSAGENLALAPSTELAMQGLMNSPGHRANILSPNFRTVGIGVIDGGIYGKMYSQEFTD